MRRRRINHSHFNSIKVRLNPEAAQQRGHLTPEFQFHKGTIKPSAVYFAAASSSDFNSIKVRLNPKDLSFYDLPAVFQFHKGTIKPNLGISILNKVNLFQFHKGTIKPIPSFSPSSFC